MNSRLLCLALIASLGFHLAAETPPPAKAQRYHQLLLKKPQPGTVLDRFVDAWLEEGTSASLHEFLTSQSTRPETTPNDHLLLALYLSREGTDDLKAIAAFTTATKADDSNATAWMEFARLHTRLLDFPNALAALDKAAAQHPDAKLAKDIAKLRGRTLLRLGRTKEALEAFAALLAASDNDQDLADELIDLQVDEGLYTEAIAQLGPMITGSKDPYLAATRRLRLGEIHLKDAKKKEALAAFGEALQQAAAGSWIESEALARIDAVFRREDDISGLAKHLDALSKDNAQRLNLLQARARVLAESNDKDGALKLFQDILQRSPGDRTLRESYLDLLERFERFPDAIAQTKLLMEQHKTDKELHLRLATLHHRANDKAASAAALDAYLAMPGVDAFDHLRVANMLDTWKRTDEAKARFATVIAANPKSFEVRDAHSQFLHRNGEREPALSIWRELAKGSVRDELMVIGSTLIARQEHAVALEVMRARVAEFGTDPQFLAPLIQAALTVKAAKEAVPWAVSRVRLSDEDTGLADALRQADTVLREAEATESTLKELAATPKPSTSDLCLISALHESLGDLAAAERVLAEPKDDPTLTAQRVRLHYGRQEYAQAAKVLEQLLATVAGKTAQNAQRRVDMLSRAGDTEAALKAIDLWKQLAPSQGQPFITQAKFLRDLGHAPEALEVLRAAHRKFDDDDAIASMLADVHAELGEYAQTERLYLRMYEQGTDDTAKVRAVRSLAEAAKLRAETSSLVKVFQERQRSNNADVVPWLALAAIYDVADRDSDELAALAEAGRLRPTDRDIALRTARLQEESGKWQQAQQTLERIATGPSAESIRTNIALIELRNGQPERAYTALAQIAGGDRMDPRDAELIADAMAATDDWARMVKFLQPLVAKNLGDYRIGYQYLVALEESGDDLAARREGLRLISITQEMQGFPKSKGSMYGKWIDQYAKGFPPGGREAMLVGMCRYSAFQYKQRNQGRGASAKGGFLELPGDLFTAHGFIGAHLVKQQPALSDEERETFERDLRATGFPAWMAIAHARPSESGSWMDFGLDAALLKKHPQDKLLHTLWHGGVSAPEPDAALNVHAFHLLKADSPKLALNHALNAVLTDETTGAEAFDEALGLIRSVKTQDMDSMYGLWNAIGARQNWQRSYSEEENGTLNDTRKAALASALIAAFESKPKADEDRARSFQWLMHGLAKAEQWADLIRITEAEVALFRANAAAQKASAAAFTLRPASNTGLTPMVFPSMGGMPEHIALTFGLPDPINTHASEVMKPLDSGDALKAALDQVKEPHLRIYLAWWAGDTERAKREAAALVGKPDASAADFHLAAGLAQKLDDDTQALELLAQASTRSMSADVRKLIDNDLIVVLQAVEKIPATSLDAAKLALRRVANTNAQARNTLPDLMERAEMKEEAKRLVAMNAATRTASSSVSYSSSRSGSASKIDDLIRKGNVEGAARELMASAGSQMDQFARGYVWWPKEDARRLLQTKSREPAAKHLLESLKKKATTAKAQRDYAIYLDLLGHEDEARVAYAEALKAAPNDGLCLGRLIGLWLRKDDREAAKIIAGMSLKQLVDLHERYFHYYLNGGYELNHAQRLPWFRAIEAKLREMSRDKPTVPPGWWDLVISASDELVAPSMCNGDGARLKKNLAHRDQAGSKDELLQKYRDVNASLCEAMLAFPELSEAAFRSLVCTKSDAELEPLAERLVRAAAASGVTPPARQRFTDNRQYSIEDRWQPAPLQYLIDRAARAGQIERVEKEWLPLAERAESKPQAKLTRALAKLWQCAETEFPTAAKQWTLAAARPNQYNWNYSPDAALPVTIYTQRKLKVSLVESIATELKNSSWRSPRSALDYLKTKPTLAEQKAVLSELISGALGRGQVGIKRLNKAHENRNGPGSNNDGAGYAFTELLEELAKAPETVAVAVRGAAELGVAKEHLGVAAARFEWDDEDAHPDRFVQRLRALGCLDDLPAYDIVSVKAEDRSLMADLFDRLDRHKELAKQVRALLEKEPATFGRDLCLALAMPDDDHSTAEQKMLTARAADLAKLPKEHYLGFTALLKQHAKPLFKNPGAMDPALRKALEPILGAELKAKEGRADQLLATKTFAELKMEDYTFYDELRALLGQLCKKDLPKTKQLFLHCALMLETHMQQKGLLNTDQSGGWTQRSDLIGEMMEAERSIEALGFGLRMMAEDTSGQLIEDIHMNYDNAATAMHDVFKAGGGQGNVALGLTALLDRLSAQLVGASGAPTFSAFLAFSGKLAPANLVPALRWCSTSKHPLAPHLDAALRLHLGSDTQTKKNKEMMKHLDELGGIAPLWQYVSRVVADEKLPQQVRINTAARALHRRWHDADPKMVHTAADLVAEANRDYRACSGQSHTRFIMRAWIRQPMDDAWKATATKLWETWLVRNARNKEDYRFGRAYRPNEDSVEPILQVVARLGNREWIDKLMVQNESASMKHPSAFVVLLEAGQHELAAQHLKDCGMGFLLAANDNLMWTPELAAQMPAFTAACKEPGLAFFGEVIANRLKDAPEKVGGVKSLNERHVALAKRLPSVSFANPDHRRSCIEQLALNTITHEPLAKEIAAEAAKFDLAKAMALTSTHETYRYTTPLSAELGRQVRAGDAKLALEWLPKVIAALPASYDRRSNNEVPWWTAGYVFGGTVFDTNLHWEANKRFDTKALVQVYEALATQMPQGKDITHMQTAHIAARATFGLMLIHAHAGSLAPFEAWRAKLSDEQRKQLQETLKQRNVLFQQASSYVGKNTTTLPPADRAKILALVLADPWIAPLYPEKGSGVPNLMQGLAGPGKIFVPGELAIHAEELVKALPRAGRSAGEAAEVLSANGKQDAALKLFALAAESTKDENQRAIYIFRQAETLQRIDRKAEALALLKALPTANLSPGSKTALLNRLKRLGGS